jgi:lysophospholipase L1-like esterase
MIARLVMTLLAALLVAGCGSAGSTGTLATSGSPAAVSGSASQTVRPTASPSETLATPSPTATMAPTAPPTPSTAPSSPETAWRLVAVGDSIAYNSPNDCPGCLGFVDRYATAIRKATGHPVVVQNLSEHNGLQVDGLLKELRGDAVRRRALADADIIIVGIAHNDSPLHRDDDPCDGAGGDDPDWSKFDEACMAEVLEIFRPKYERVFEQIAEMRAGKPTILRALNRYNDWIGWPGHRLSADGIAATKLVVDTWSDMICSAAEASRFTCVDIYAAFNGADGLTASGDLLVDDYTHPSAKGNKVIADTLIELGYAPLAP